MFSARVSFVDSLLASFIPFSPSPFFFPSSSFLLAVLIISTGDARPERQRRARGCLDVRFSGDSFQGPSSSVRRTSRAPRGRGEKRSGVGLRDRTRERERLYVCESERREKDERAGVEWGETRAESALQHWLHDTMTQPRGQIGQLLHSG